ncbi:hypothetical protein B0H14DRAFT_1392441 [Mycena olivaceomarginata]|nr:hypothetical protein B0H14DRAFT_1392441 [Mycena olivaceomarginata]
MTPGGPGSLRTDACAGAQGGRMSPGAGKRRAGARGGGHLKEWRALIVGGQRRILVTSDLMLRVVGEGKVESASQAKFLYCLTPGGLGSPFCAGMWPDMNSCKPKDVHGSPAGLPRADPDPYPSIPHPCRGNGSIPYPPAPLCGVKHRGIGPAGPQILEKYQLGTLNERDSL